MKKRIITIILCAMMVSQTIFADELMFLDGIGNNIKAGGNTTDTSTEKIIANMAKNYTAKDQVLICHSQGGLRALAYAEYLKNLNPSDTTRVKAIVTVGSPIQGEQALLYGGRHLNYRLNRRIDKTIKTGKLIAAPALVPALIATALYDAFNGTSYHNDLNKMTSKDGIMDTIFGAVDDSFGAISVIKAAMNDPNIGFDPGALEALTPNSGFQKKYIKPGTKISIRPGYWVTRLTGYKKVLKITGYDWIFPRLEWVRVPVYKKYYIQPKITTSSIPRLTPTQKLGHVTAGGSGTEGSDILQLVEDATKGTNDEVKKSNVKAWLWAGSTISYIAGSVYGGIGVTTSLIPILGPILATGYFEDMNTCYDTAVFLGDFNTQFSKEMYLTTAHDGFVNTSSMVYPSGNNNGWLLETRDKSKKNFPELNHLTERTSPKVWGSGGAFVTTVIENGVKVQKGFIKGGFVNTLLEGDVTIMGREGYYGY